MFRSEVISRRNDRLVGDLAIAIPVTWQAIGYLIFASLLVALLFLSMASYSRTETARGTIAPDSGVSTILPTREGVVVLLPVVQGEEVAAGTPLAIIRTEQDTSDGRSAAARSEAALADQISSLSAQESATQASAAAQQLQADARRSGLAAEIGQIEAQVALQRDLVTAAQRDLERIRTVAERGFISRNDLRSREEAVLVRRQQLSQFMQALSSARARLAEAERNSTQIAGQGRAQVASIAAARAAVAVQAEGISGSRAYVLRAPVAGRVTALTARVGQPADPQTPLMVIIPAASRLRAELSVPNTAIGFVRPGQEVRLSIDAFPYQRFGTIGGRVLAVATSAVNQPGRDGVVESAYPVTVALERDWVTAYGRQEPLVSGMTLSARIVTERRSLLEWLFEPLFAVRRR